MTRVRANTLAMAGVFVTQATFVFLQIKLLTHWLDPDRFGLFSSVFAFGALLGSVSELGFSVVLVRYGAKFAAEGRPADLGRLLRAAVGLWLAAGAVLGLLLLALARPVAAQIDRTGVSPSLLMTGFLAAWSFSMRAFASAAFQGRRRMMPALVLELIYMLGLTATIVAIGPRLTPRIVLLSLFGWSVLTGLTGFLLFARERPSVMLEGADAAGPARSTRELLAGIGGFWGGAFLTTVVAISLENADRLVLAGLTSFTVVAAWHVAARISLFIRKILFVPQQVAGPEMAFKWEQGRVGEVADDLRLFMRLEWALGTLLAIGVALGARAGVLLASDHRYLQAAPALVALAAALPVLSLQAPMTTFLRATGRIGITVRAELLYLVGSIAVGAALLPRWGLTGFGLGNLFAAFGAVLYTASALRRQALPRPSGRFLAAHAGSGLLLWGGAAAVAHHHPWSSVYPVGLAGALIAVIYGLALGRSRFFNDGERGRLRLLAGPGAPARIADFFLGASRGVMER